MARFTAATCDLPHESQENSVVVMMSVLFGTAVIFTVLRMVSKLLTGTFCTEDYLVLGALGLTVVPAAGVLQSWC